MRCADLIGPIFSWETMMFLLCWNRNLHYLNMKMYLTINDWTVLEPKTQLNTIHLY